MTRGVFRNPGYEIRKGCFKITRSVTWITNFVIGVFWEGGCKGKAGRKGAVRERREGRGCFDLLGGCGSTEE